MHSLTAVAIVWMQALAQSNPSTQPAGGWEAGSGTRSPASRAAALSPKEQQRYDQVAIALLQAIKADDKAAYRALHSDEGWNTAIDWWQAMFVRQRARFGPITRAYPGVRGMIRFSKFAYESELADGASFVILFEEKVGGVLTFRLDEAGKIAATSVFIKEELREYAPDGVKPIFPPPKP